jgi:hypothetical protein
MRIPLKPHKNLEPPRDRIAKKCNFACIVFTKLFQQVVVAVAFRSNGGFESLVGLPEHNDKSKSQDFLLKSEEPLSGSCH